MHGLYGAGKGGGPFISAASGKDVLFESWLATPLDVPWAFSRCCSCEFAEAYVGCWPRKHSPRLDVLKDSCGSTSGFGDAVTVPSETGKVPCRQWKEYWTELVRARLKRGCVFLSECGKWKLVMGRVQLLKSTGADSRPDPNRSTRTLSMNSSRTSRGDLVPKRHRQLPRRMFLFPIIGATPTQTHQSEHRVQIFPPQSRVDVFVIRTCPCPMYARCKRDMPSNPRLTLDRCGGSWIQNCFGSYQWSVNSLGGDGRVVNRDPNQDGGLANLAGRNSP
eukprot:1048745-Rhodomonas_salina.1